jgi:sec-independent protein translocase protein TatA
VPVGGRRSAVGGRRIWNTLGFHPSQATSATNTEQLIDKARFPAAIEEGDRKVHIITPGEIFGVDGIVILIVAVLVLFGSTQIPKLANSLGSARKEFKKGLDEGDGGSDGVTSIPQIAASTVVVPPGATVSVNTAGDRLSGSSS